MGRVLTAAYSVYETDPRVRREAEALSAAGFDVTVYCLDRAGVPRKREHRSVRIRSLPIRRYMGSSAASYMISYLWFIGVITAIFAVKSLTSRVQAIHLHTLPDFIVIAGIIPRLRGSYVVLDIHDFMAENYCTKFGLDRKARRARFLRWCTKWCADRADTVLTVHLGAQEKLVEYGVPLEHVVICLNTADDSLFFPSTISREDGRFRVMSHGTVAHRLGFDLLVRAVVIARKSIDNLEVYIIGSGDAESEVRQLISELRVEDVVHFQEGLVPLDRVAELVRVADLGVVATRRDPTTDLMLPLKLVEFHMSGVPAVTSKLATVERYFDHFGVLYFESDDAEDLARAIVTAASDPELMRRLRDETSVFRERHGWGPEAHRLVELFVSKTCGDVRDGQQRRASGRC
jgi:glycosyltransferase involved in cell wall biosynthesis